MNLYHYRAIENAILELANGTFHFSTREELNDPLEGYLKIYWQGDKIAWEGLLKNYICSIDNAISLFLLQQILLFPFIFLKNFNFPYPNISRRLFHNQIFRLKRQKSHCEAD